MPLFATVLALSLFCYGLFQTVAVLAFTLNIPNEIRGLGLGIFTLVASVFGVATAPALIPLASRAMGGEEMLAQAIAVVSAPSAVVSAVFLGLALRGGAARRAVI